MIGTDPYIVVNCGQRYIDRGDYEGPPDFTELTLDGNFHELDLSAIVPAAGANHLVLIKLNIGHTGTPTTLKTKGNVQLLNSAERTGQTGADNPSVWVKCDADRKIEYASADENLYLFIRGYWVG